MKKSRRAVKTQMKPRQNLQIIRSEENITDRFDGFIHERTRLGIVTALSANGKLSFADMKDILKISDGNLSVHSRKLEEAGYIRITKSFSGRIPRTEYEITPAGREALHRYLNHMERLINAMKEPRQNND